MNNEEVWAPIPCLDGKYEVSNIGRVRGLKYRWGLRKQPKLIKSHKSRDGYHRVVLMKEDGSNKMWSLHRLVLTAFLGKKPSNVDACHLDGDKSNNKLSNLCWGSRKENMSHIPKSERKSRKGLPKKRLEEDEVVDLMFMFSYGCNRHDIADRYGLAMTSLHEIARGNQWKEASLINRSGEDIFGGRFTTSNPELCALDRLDAIRIDTEHNLLAQQKKAEVAG